MPTIAPPSSPRQHRMSDYSYLAARLPHPCRGYIASLLVGDHLAGGMTAIHITPRRASELSIDIAEAGCSPSACRALFYGAWAADNSAVIEVVGMPHRLAALLEYAELPHPPGEVVTLWRGAAVATLEDATRGLCWADNYATACYFALRQHWRKGHPPIVVTARFPAGSVFLLHDELPALGASAREYVAPEPPEIVEVVGNAEEWQANAALVGFSGMAALPEKFRDSWPRFIAMHQHGRDTEGAA